MSNLHEYFLAEGNPELLECIRPAFVILVTKLKALERDGNVEQRRAAFAEAFACMNQYEDEIETIERETILGTMYEIGELVGFERESEFA